MLGPTPLARLALLRPSTSLVSRGEEARRGEERRRRRRRRHHSRRHGDTTSPRSCVQQRREIGERKRKVEGGCRLLWKPTGLPYLE